LLILLNVPEHSPLYQELLDNLLILSFNFHPGVCLWLIV
jgi:hypothetical protein